MQKFNGTLIHPKQIGDQENEGKRKMIDKNPVRRSQVSSFAELRQEADNGYPFEVAEVNSFCAHGAWFNDYIGIDI